MLVSRRVQDVDGIGDWVRVRTDGAELWLLFVEEGILRIRAGFATGFAEQSYTLTTTAWPDRLDEFMGSERTRVEPIPADLIDQADLAYVSGGGLRVRIDKDPFRLSVHDADGALLHSDVPGLAYLRDANGRRVHTSEIGPEDSFYGFGETTGDLEKSQQLVRMSPKDALGYDARMTDPLYKHIPFYIKLDGTSRSAVGYFYHNTYDCEFDLGRQKSNYWPRHSQYRTDGGDIDLFVIAGPRMRDVIRRYTWLTGRPALLPRHSLGYLASSMYYAELESGSDQAITRFIDIAGREGIPVDGFQLSSGYCTQDTPEGQKRCVFTWNRDRFADPGGFFEAMTDRGVAVSPNVKPGVLRVHPRLEEFTKRDVFVGRSADAIELEGDGPAEGAWWGGPGHFVDFTSPTVRQWWKRWLTESVLDYGTTSVWNDNCEYDGLIDQDAQCSFDGAGGTIGELRNLMANLMCRITHDAISEKDPQVRPFVVCRAGHAGIQRYAQTWAGDNSTSWQTLQHNVATVLGMSLSGVANHGCDIGGFHGPAPDPELLVRWVQHGIFQPRFSIHSVNSDNTVTEPWMYPEHTAYVRDAIKLRYRLLPYLYSLMARAHHTGLPIVEPLVSAFQQDPGGDENYTEFMLGDALLVATVLTQGAKSRQVRVPAGEVFYDLWTRRRHMGGDVADLPVDLSSIPLFIRAGGIVPFSGRDVSRTEIAEVTDLHVVLATGADGDFELYEDDGRTKAYEHGVFRRTHISMADGDRVSITISPSGSYKSPVKSLLLDVINPDSSPYWVRVADDPLPHILYRKDFEDATTGWTYAPELGSVLLRLPNPQTETTVTISFEPFDMIGM